MDVRATVRIVVSANFDRAFSEARDVSNGEANQAMTLVEPEVGNDFILMREPNPYAPVLGHYMSIWIFNVLLAISGEFNECGEIGHGRLIHAEGGLRSMPPTGRCRSHCPSPPTR